MNNFDFTNFNDNNDFEEKEDLLWNEFDWQNYLKETKKNILEVLATYLKVKQREGFIRSIDKVLDTAEGVNASFSNEDMEIHSEPYTLHNHPLLLITQALYFHIQSTFEAFITNNPGKLSALIAFQFTLSLHKGEEHSLLAIYALDTNDPPLAVCHLKYAMSCVNESLRILQSIYLPTLQVAKNFLKELSSSLLDLREFCLRIMNDARNNYTYFQDLQDQDDEDED